MKIKTCAYRCMNTATIHTNTVLMANCQIFIDLTNHSLFANQEHQGLGVQTMKLSTTSTSMMKITTSVMSTGSQWIATPLGAG